MERDTHRLHGPSDRAGFSTRPCDPAASPMACLGATLTAPWPQSPARPLPAAMGRQGPKAWRAGHS